MRVYFGSSYYRTAEALHVASLVALVQRCHERGARLQYAPTCGDALIERSRARSATKFLDTDCDVWLSVDGDIVFSPDDALTLCEQALAHDVVGGLYMTRSTTGGRPTCQLEKGRRYRLGSDPTPVPLTYAATGFMAVAREVFVALAETLPLLHRDDPTMRHYPFFRPFDVDGIELSEDWAFCHRAQEAGFGIWLNPAIRLAHLGLTACVAEDMLAERPAGKLVGITYRGDGNYSLDHGIPAGAAANGH